ncbi:polyprenyl synthetase family protein [Paenibacillus sp. NPDC058071]|uniref:polyprenyl synthetase family protein n=1 Tax=Paenibacillus sp. NPDC058071 TaxID=3346326 RepID=UPI0036DDA9A2
MNNDLLQLKQEMQRLSETYFTAKPLAEYASAFIEHKHAEPLRFGMLSVLHYRMFGGKDELIYKAAASVELFILASDIIDDLQDQDSPHQPWSRAPLPVSLQLAAALMSLSQQALLDCGTDSLAVLRTADMMNRQWLQSANGQMTDIMNLVNEESDYLDVVRQKSAALLVMACMTGVMLTGRDWHPGVADYALELGMAAQIENDRRDLVRRDDKNDFAQRKKTALTLYLLEDLSEHHGWIGDYFAGRLSIQELDDRFEEFARICEESGALLYGSALFNLHFNRFQELLREVPEAAASADEIMRIVSGNLENSGIPQ